MKLSDDENTIFIYENSKKNLHLMKINKEKTYSHYKSIEKVYILDIFTSSNKLYFRFKGFYYEYEIDSDEQYLLKNKTDIKRIY